MCNIAWFVHIKHLASQHQIQHLRYNCSTGTDGPIVCNHKFLPKPNPVGLITKLLTLISTQPSTQYSAVIASRLQPQPFVVEVVQSFLLLRKLLKLFKNIFLELINSNICTRVFSLPTFVKFLHMEYVHTVLCNDVPLQLAYFKIRTSLHTKYVHTILYCTTCMINCNRNTTC